MASSNYVGTFPAQAISFTQEDGRASLGEAIPAALQQQPMMLYQPSISMDQANFQCPTCPGIFPLRKTLNRHLRTVHQPSKIRCSHCELEFNRKDIKDRHELEQHGTLSDMVECSVCHVQVRQRALSSHFNSKRHGRAQKHANEIQLTSLKAGRDLRASQILDTEALIHPRLVTAWLFHKLMARLRSLPSSLWIDITTTSFEILKLKGQALRSIGNMIEQRSLLNSTELMAPVARMVIVEWLLGEWEQAKPHIRVLVSLRDCGLDPTPPEMAALSDMALLLLALMYEHRTELSRLLNELVHPVQGDERSQRQEKLKRMVTEGEIYRCAVETSLANSCQPTQH